MSAGPSSLSGDGGLTGTFGSTSGQVTPGYASSQGNLGQLDVASEAIESTSAALLRCYILNATLGSMIFFLVLLLLIYLNSFCFSASSIHIGSAAGLTQQTTENDPLNASFSSTISAPELHSVDTTDAVKVRNFIWVSFCTGRETHAFY